MIIISSGIVVVVVFWIVVYLIDTTFKQSRKYGLQYIESLRETGFSLSIAHIRWQTAVCNKTFMRIGRWKPKLLLYWFNLGALFGCLSMFASVFLLFGMLYKSATESKPEQVLQPVMPGLNLPWNQVLYYLATLIVSGGFHEIGHALAAVRENVRVNSFGLFILFVYPGAFVELHTDQLEIITPVRKLRIYTAGVWHNFVLALAALSLSSSLPYLLSPFYETGQGVAVTWISHKCSISSNLPIGDVVISVDDCQVRNLADWYWCLRRIQTEPPLGYCNTKNYIKTHNTSLPLLVMNYNEPDCCNDTSSYRFCYYYERNHKKSDSISHASDTNKLVRTSTGEFISTFREHACLPARSTVTHKKSCMNNEDCNVHESIDSLCLKPFTSNFTHLIRLTHTKGQEILFVGDSNELISYIRLSDHIPKSMFLPLNLPGHLHTLAMYFLSISSALAILNMVPCFFLDGHQTLSALLEHVFPDRPVIRSFIEPCTLFLGSILLVSNILLALYSLVRQ